MADSKKSVLITGCSDGGLGSALAIAFHDAGLHVYATARNPAKMKELQSRGIETLTLDVLSKSSIEACVAKIPSLDILINNAGAVHVMPLADLNIADAKQLFDLNVWACLEVSQAFLPLLLKSKGMIVNHTSGASIFPLPFQSAYNASKAAFAMFTATQRLELEPFGITVIDLKTGFVKSNISANKNQSSEFKLPKGSIYEPAREVLEQSMKTGGSEGAESAETWSANVVQDLLKETPPPLIFRGAQAELVRDATTMPYGTLDETLKQITKLNVVGKLVQK